MHKDDNNDEWQGSEADLMRKIMLECTSANTRLFRNNVGKLQNNRDQWVSYGLGVGSSDLICIRDGLFIAIEVKLPGQKPTKEQQNFIDTIRAMGGRAGVAHSVEEAKGILNGNN
jgi:hypothetical protein